ncbi:hypothetical protein BDA96_07G171700 [Sorghum bicolor]|uniref:Uncharacterized protein n=1 Tax=Sorghum bicolor TaxID=4558 RepID=A0A921QLH9_SORBI|nr:hypothetical protein BDA96_07G171700 [Sorghum bicolor]
MVPWPIAQPFISTKGTFKSPLGSGNTICIYHSKRKGLRLALMKVYIQQNAFSVVTSASN